MGPAADVRDPPRRARARQRAPAAGGRRPRDGVAGPARHPRRFWVYAGFAVLYGVCETVNGNWAQLDMTDLGSSTTAASIALTAFWAMVTVGRILFAAIEAWFPSRLAYHVLPSSSPAPSCSSHCCRTTSPCSASSRSASPGSVLGAPAADDQLRPEELSAYAAAAAAA